MMYHEMRIYVAGGTTLVGSAIIRQLQKQGFSNLVGVGDEEPDLCDAVAVEMFFARARPEVVFFAAGRSGGIFANQKYPADLMLDNLLAEINVIHSAYKHHVSKLLYLASSCIYPKHSPQPMQVASLMTGPLEPTNEAYAVAKLAGLKLCESYRAQFGANFITAIPANPFGLGDDFSPEDSHVIGALIHRIDEAKQQGHASVEIWGTGTPRREFIFSDDLANACIFLAEHYADAEPINVGSGHALTIKELALTIRDVIGYSGDIAFNSNRPDGMPFKALDSSKLLAMGWHSITPLSEAVATTYLWYLETQQNKESI